MIGPRGKLGKLCAVQLCCWAEDLGINIVGSRSAIMKMLCILGKNGVEIAVACVAGSLTPFKARPYLFLARPQKLWDISFNILLLSISLERFEPCFAAIYATLKFCPELKISKIGNQNSGHFQHVAHIF